MYIKIYFKNYMLCFNIRILMCRPMSDDDDHDDDDDDDENDDETMIMTRPCHVAFAYVSPARQVMKVTLCLTRVFVPAIVDRLGSMRERERERERERKKKRDRRRRRERLVIISSVPSYASSSNPSILFSR